MNKDQIHCLLRVLWIHEKITSNPQHKHLLYSSHSLVLTLSLRSPHISFMITSETLVIHQNNITCLFSGNGMTTHVVKQTCMQCSYECTITYSCREIRVQQLCSTDRRVQNGFYRQSLTISLLNVKHQVKAVIWWWYNITYSSQLLPILKKYGFNEFVNSNTETCDLLFYRFVVLLIQ